MTLHERVQTDTDTRVSYLMSRGTAPNDIIAFVRVTFSEVLAALQKELTPKPAPAVRIAEATEPEASPVTWKPIRGLRGYAPASVRAWDPPVPISGIGCG